VESSAIDDLGETNLTLATRFEMSHSNFIIKLNELLELRLLL
jgi:hypothetical protein